MNRERSAPTRKLEFYRRFRAGEFGNRPRLWATLDELVADAYGGTVTARDMSPGGPCFYGVRPDDVRAGKAGFDPRGYRFNESMPDEHLLIQGNAWRDAGGLCLEYSEAPGIGHRDAMRPPHTRAVEVRDY